ncbi:MAG: hypothetical protein J6A05_06975 [Oscillospiraceae bacterium]|nr:hypothetical protein [Oscillospiraceae bacterium]
MKDNVNEYGCTTSKETLSDKDIRLLNNLHALPPAERYAMIEVLKGFATGKLTAQESEGFLYQKIEEYNKKEFGGDLCEHNTF